MEAPGYRLMIEPQPAGLFGDEDVAAREEPGQPSQLRGGRELRREVPGRPLPRLDPAQRDRLERPHPPPAAREPVAQAALREAIPGERALAPLRRAALQDLLLLQVAREPRRAHRALRAYEAGVRRGLRVFSWFIYRIMTPGLRDIFMNPNNRLRLRDALLSVLAGNIFLRTRLALRLLVLKALYYLLSAGHPRRSWAAWRSRGHATREAGIETITA